MVTLRLEIDRQAKHRKPIYRQIADQVIGQIRDGSLPNGSQLPTVRELAGHLDITRVTAHNAYNELKADGWIDATVGRGTYVMGLPSPSTPLETTADSALTPDRMMEDMNRLQQLPGTRSMAMAEPDSSLMPTSRFMGLLRSLERHANDLFHYGPYQGEPDLRHMVSGLLLDKNIRANPDDILITTGVTQGLSLAVAALCEPGDKVIVEQPTYLGFLGILESCGVEPVGVPLDEEGPRLDVLEKILLRERPRVFYTIPSFQNPTGLSMSEERRRQVLELAAEYGLTIIEDDIYGLLSYDGAPPPPLKARDRDDLVVYLDSFSKVLLPGLRVGYVVPPVALKERILSLLRVRELGGPPLLQRALAEFIRRGFFQDHLKRVIPAYRKKRDVFVDALTRSMPEGVQWTSPRGGYCAWITLPEQGDFDQLYRTVLARGVAFTPGEVFLTTSDRRKHLRLCFSSQDAQGIREAVSTLGGVIKEMTVRRSVASSRSGLPKPIV